MNVATVFAVILLVIVVLVAFFGDVILEIRAERMARRRQYRAELDQQILANMAPTRRAAPTEPPIDPVYADRLDYWSVWIADRGCLPQPGNAEFARDLNDHPNLYRAVMDLVAGPRKTVLTFGKYKGIRICDVPNAYVHWIATATGAFGIPEGIRDVAEQECWARYWSYVYAGSPATWPQKQWGNLKRRKSPTTEDGFADVDPNKDFTVG